MRRVKFLADRLAGMAVLLLALGPVRLLAAGLDEELEFDLQAGPLGHTLLAIARQAGTVISFKPALVRGLPATFALSGMRSVRGVFPAEAALIERVEVPKGPSSVIGGIADFGGRGGVVNLVRKQAGPEVRLNLAPGRMLGPLTLSVFVRNVFDRQIYAGAPQSDPRYLPLEPGAVWGSLRSTGRIDCVLFSLSAREPAGRTPAGSCKVRENRARMAAQPSRGAKNHTNSTVVQYGVRVFTRTGWVSASARSVRSGSSSEKTPLMRICAARCSTRSSPGR
jgi:hypothetical protein